MLRLVKNTDQEMPTESSEQERIVLTRLELPVEGGKSLRLCICTGHQNGEAFLIRPDEISGSGAERTARCPRCELGHAVIGFSAAVRDGRISLDEGVYCIPPALLVTALSEAD